MNRYNCAALVEQLHERVISAVAEVNSRVVGRKPESVRAELIKCEFCLFDCGVRVRQRERGKKPEFLRVRFDYLRALFVYFADIFYLVVPVCAGHVRR